MCRKFLLIWKTGIVLVRKAVYKAGCRGVRVTRKLNLTTLFELARGLGVHPKELIDYDFDFLKEEL